MSKTEIPKYEERQILEWLRSIMHRVPSVIVDIGGNKDAEISDLFIRLGWRSLIVEPQQACVELLRLKFADFPNCEIYHGACSDEAGELQLYHGLDGDLSEVATLNTRSDPWMDQVRSDRSQTVKVVRLGDLLEQLSFPKTIGVLKVDTESWDAKVLRGIDFNKYKVSVIITEEYYWDVEGTISKHIALEDSGFVNLGFVGYNTIWANNNLGARFSFVLLKDWLNEIGAYPTATLGSSFVTTTVPQLEVSSRVSQPMALGDVLILAEPVRSMVCGSATVLNISVVNMGSLTIKGDRDLPRISYHWLRNDAEALRWDCGGERISEAIMPHTAVKASIVIQAPDESGRFILRVDLVDDGVGWYFDRGATVAQQAVTILSN